MSVLNTNLKEGEFQMLHAKRSDKGYYLVGAIIGGKEGGVITKKAIIPDDIMKATDRLREQIHKQWPGIKEI